MIEEKDYVPSFLERIELYTIPDQCYVSLCFEAMKQICTSLDTICDYKKNNYEVDGDVFLVYERNYVIALAVELAKRHERLDTTGLKEVISGEVVKSLSLAYSSVRELYVRIRKELDKHYKGKKKDIFVLPDFLIHESHSYQDGKLDEEHQHLAMEVKTREIKRKELFQLDFLKLNYYLDSLNFANVIYVLVGTPVKTIDDYIESYYNEIKYKSAKASKQLYFFIQEKFKSEPVIYKLK